MADITVAHRTLVLRDTGVALGKVTFCDFFSVLINFPKKKNFAMAVLVCMVGHCLTISLFCFGSICFGQLTEGVRIRRPTFCSELKRECTRSWKLKKKHSHSRFSVDISAEAKRETSFQWRTVLLYCHTCVRLETQITAAVLQCNCHLRNVV